MANIEKYNLVVATVVAKMHLAVLGNEMKFKWLGSAAGGCGLHPSEADALAGLHVHCLRQLHNGLHKQLGGSQAGGCLGGRCHLLLAPGRQQL